MNQPLKVIDARFAFPCVEYRDIPGHAGYKAGSDGTILSYWRFKGAGYGGRCYWIIGDTPRILKPSPRKEDGRARYTVRRDDGSPRRCFGSTLVLEAFKGPRPEGMECCHEDGNCLNDAAYNLRWGTSVSNKADMRRHGTFLSGDKSPVAKLKDAQIPEILAMRKSGTLLRRIGIIFGVTEQRIHQICKRGKR